MRRPHLIKDPGVRRFPPLPDRLGPYSQTLAVEMLRAGRDTAQAASLLACSESAVWNAVAAVKDCRP